MDFKFELKAKAKDMITGFSGIIMGRIDYATGCRQYLINPGKIGKEGAPMESQWFDEDRIMLIGGVSKMQTRNVGGPVRGPTGLH